MRSLLSLAVAAVLGLSSAALVACGDRNNLIPQDDAAAIKSDLQEASDDFAAEECRRAERAVRQAQDRVAELPGDVDAGLRENLEQGLDHVFARVRDDCGKRRDTTPTTPTVTQPTETQDTTTETTPTITEPEPPEPEPTTQPRRPPGLAPGPPDNSGGTPPAGEDPD